MQAHEVGARSPSEFARLSETTFQTGRTSITRFAGSLVSCVGSQGSATRLSRKRDSALRFTLGFIRVARIRGLGWPP